MSLKFEQIEKSYRTGRMFKKQNVLSDLNYNLENGKVLALVGQNGAGKTTLIKCMMDFIHVDSGKISMDEKTITNQMKDGNVGYMPEVVKGPELITLKEYIKDILLLRGKKIALYQDRFDFLTKRLYLNEHLEKPFSKCSKGTVKKAIFLQAIIHEPKLLILDEPTDGLDPISRKVMLDEINKMKKKGTTVIITTHLLSDITLVADQVVVLQKGKLIADTKIEELNHSLEEWYYNVIMENGRVEEL